MGIIYSVRFSNIYEIFIYLSFLYFQLCNPINRVLENEIISRRKIIIQL
jgi:hypothetical protein